MLEKVYIRQHVTALKLKAAQKYNISPEKCHIGHVILQGLLDRPHDINQIDVGTDERESNLSVAIRSSRLASAMNKFGLKIGDSVIIMGRNHLDIVVPFYAAHFNGLTICPIDVTCKEVDLQALVPNINPKIVFCEKDCEKKVKEALKINSLQAEIVFFKDKDADLAAFIKRNKGTEHNFRPADFDHFTTTAWLMLTSGTTGLPKVAIIPYDTVLNAIYCWWEDFTGKIETNLSMSYLQWISALIAFTSGPLRCFTRLQSSQTFTPQVLVAAINKYRPVVTTWTPYLVSQFVEAIDSGTIQCDLTCFKYIAIGGAFIDKPLLDSFKKKCPAFIYIAYGMTELMVPIFKFDLNTPDNSVGYPVDKYQFKLVDDDGSIIDKPYKVGELWIKGDDFFKGYLNSPEETEKMLTKDGWFMTGDLFQRDEHDYYYYADRKRLIIKHYYAKISPLQLEETIKRHPGVNEACVVGVPEPSCMELPTAAILRRNGSKVDPEEIFSLLKNALPDDRQLFGGIFFVDSFPMTPSGKINRVKVRELAISTKTILPK